MSTSGKQKQEQLQLSKNLNTLKYLSDICVSKSKVMTRMARVCFQTNKYPAAVELSIVFIKYIQLITQVILYNFYLNGGDNSNYASDWYSSAFIFIAKLFNPAFWLSYNQNHEIAIFTTLMIIIAFILARYAVFSYVVFITYKNLRGYPVLIRLWGYIFKIQGSMIYSIISPFWVNTILYFSNTGFKTIGIGATPLLVLCLVIITSEYCFSLFLQVRFWYVLPTPSLLACKNNRTEITLLSQKLAIHIMTMAFKPNSTPGLWVFSSINLFICLCRDFEYFRGLPFYNLKTLYYQGVLLQVFTSLNIACWIQHLAKSGEFKEYDMAFVLVLWIILASLFTKLALQYLDNMKTKILASPNSSHNLITFKISVLKDLRKSLQLPVEAHRTFKWSYLINNSANINLAKILSGVVEGEENRHLQNINSKQSLDKMILQHLEDISSKHPKDDFLRIYIAYYYAKKLKMFCNAVKIITDLQKHNSSNAVVNASLMIFEIQDVLRSQYLEGKNRLDFFTYSVSVSRMAGLQMKMFEQADQQIQVYQELIKEIPDVAVVFKSSQQIDRLRTNIIAGIEKQLQNVPDYYIHSFITAAEYHLKLNHSFSDYIRYRKLYRMKFRKYEIRLKDPQLNQENSYQGNSVFLQLASNRNDEGKILFCTKSAESVFGGSQDLYIGSRITSMMPPTIHDYYSQIFENLVEKGNLHDLVNQEHLFLFHRQGFAIQATYDINIHPFLTQGFYLDMIIKPLPQNGGDFIITKENGIIECASRRVAQKLGLLLPRNSSQTKSINISSLNPQLAQINDLFNENTGAKLSERKAKDQDQQQQPENLSSSRDSNQAQQEEDETDLFKKYTEGTEIYLHSLLEANQNIKASEAYSTLLYQIKIQPLVYGTTTLKFMALEEIRNRDHEFDPYESHQMDLTARILPPPPQTPGEQCNMDSEEDEKETQSINIQNFTPKDSLFPTITTIPENLQTDLPLNEPDLRSSRNHTPSFPKVELSMQSQWRQLPSWKILNRQATGPIPFTKANIERLKAQQNIERAAKSETLLTTNNGQPEDDEKKTKIILPKFNEGSVATSKFSTTTNYNKAANAFTRAVNTKHYSKFFRIASFIFYGGLILILALHINLKVDLDSTLNNLAAKRNVVSNLHLRDFHSVYLEAVLRKVWDLYTGRLNLSNIGAFALFASYFLQWGAARIQMLSDVNKEMIQNSNFMDNKSKDVLFDNDIRVYDTFFSPNDGTYTNLTSFQATDRIVEAGLHIMANQNNLSLAESQFYFIFKNTLNDLLIHNKEISTVFTGNIDSEKDDMMNTVKVYLAIELICLFLLSFFFTFIISRQYLKEKRSMIAVTRLNNQKIENSIQTLRLFKVLIQNENFEDSSLQGMLNGTKSLPATSKSKSKANKTGDATKERLKNPKVTGLTRKYYFYTFKFLIFIFALIGLAIFSYSIDSNSMDFFKTKEAQLEFTESMRSRLYLYNIASQELLTSLNDTATIENIPCSKYLADGIQTIPSIRVTAGYIYREKDGEYDPRILNLLYKDGCSSLGVDFVFVCSLLGQYGAGNSPGLIYLIDILEGTLEGMYEKYVLSNKTEVELIAIQSADHTKLTAVAEVLGGQATQISQILLASFEQELDSVQHKRNIVMVVFALLAFVIGLTVGIFVLKRVREAENKFKNVLKLFPANLVLSSFLLKNFLVDTSEGALDSVKNDL